MPDPSSSLTPPLHTLFRTLLLPPKLPLPLPLPPIWYPSSVFPSLSRFDPLSFPFVPALENHAVANAVAINLVKRLLPHASVAQAKKKGTTLVRSITYQPTYYLPTDRPRYIASIPPWFWMLISQGLQLKTGFLLLIQPDSSCWWYCQSLWNNCSLRNLRTRLFSIEIHRPPGILLLAAPPSRPLLSSANGIDREIYYRALPCLLEV